MSENEIHLGDIGTIFRVTIKEIDAGVAATIDISGAITKELIFIKPSRTKVIQTADFTNAGTDGKMQYTAILGDIDEVGWWSIQGYVEMATGEWRTNIQQFRVFGNL